MQPKDRLSPRSRLVPPIKILCSTQHWTLAEFGWDDDANVLGICWNGDISDPNDKGNPRSHGEGTWFIIPTEVAFVLRHDMSLLNLYCATQEKIIEQDVELRQAVRMA